MAALDTVETLAQKCKESSPPVQWVWALLLFAAALLAGFLLSREAEATAKMKSDIESQKRRAEEYKRLAGVSKNVLAAAQLRAAADQLVKDAQKRQAAIDQEIGVLNARKRRLERAKTWEDLDNA